MDRMKKLLISGIIATLIIYGLIWHNISAINREREASIQAQIEALDRRKEAYDERISQLLSLRENLTIELDSGSLNPPQAIRSSANATVKNSAEVSSSLAGLAARKPVMEPARIQPAPKTSAS